MELVVLTSAFIGIVLILLTKFFWQGALLSVGSFVAYYFIFGSGNGTHLLVVLVGLLLMALELLLPSFGIVGVVGIVMSTVGLSLSQGNLALTLTNAALALLLATGFAVILLKCGCRFQMGRALVLHNVIDKRGGYQSHQKNYDHLLHQTGVTLTSLRPIGRANIQQEDIEVLAVGEMIAQNERVIVYKIEDNRVFVKKIK